MSTRQRIIIANIVGIVVLALGMWGINVDDETQKLIVGGLGAIGTVINMSIVHFRGQKTLIADELEAFRERELGFALPSLCALLAGVLTVILIVGALPGCGHVPETPRQAIAAGFVAVESLAEAAEIAYRDGHIDADQRSVIKTDLQAALDALTEARRLEATGGDASGRLEYARAVLLAIQKLLPHEEPVR